MEIRNIAIIAHVDHGKTTLTDAIMCQTGMFDKDMSMDTDTLEKERGITIYSKNTSVFYKDTKINIVDTPGHADFGSEVERVLRAVDSVLLIVDAQEGPMPQTRFVLKKSLELGIKPIVVLNKIDKPAADPHMAEGKVLDLFCDLGADDEQLDFTTIYAVGRDGVAMIGLDDERKNLEPLLDTILKEVKPANAHDERPLRTQPFNLAYDNYLGRLAIARVFEGAIRVGDTVYIKKTDGETRTGKVNKLFTFKGVSRQEVKEAHEGDIVMIAGLPNIYIGETVCATADQEPLPAIDVDEPTITLDFLVNDSPFAGLDGDFVTSRQIGERLEKELEVNVGLEVDFSTPERFKVAGRGELHIAILLENMRREGYEIQLSQPHVIIKEIDGKKHEPFEEITIDIPSESQGIVIEKLGKRGAILSNMIQENNTLRLVFEGPTRGLLGYRRQFVVDTRGEGILSSRFLEFRPHIGDIQKHSAGSMVSMMKGKVLGYALDNLQARGALYIKPNISVYQGMVIGNTSKGQELWVNPTKGKQLTNVRASGTDDKINLTPPLIIGIEDGMEIMKEDEYLEITPKNVRLRKKVLRAP